MRRDYFTLAVSGVSWVETDDEPVRPAVRIAYTGPTGQLTDRLTDSAQHPLSPGDIDVTFRYQPPAGRERLVGVISITDRHTGEYVLEVNVDADRIGSFVRAAAVYGERTDSDDDHYRIVIDIDSEEVATFDKRTLLVYDHDGNLQRNQSLIPSGVEL